MDKITRKQRIELMQNGFYKCGYTHITNVKECDERLARLQEQLTEEFETAVRANNTRLTIDKVRSKDFIDNEGCFYDLKGQTFQHGQFLIHVYSYDNYQGGTASVSLLAEAES